MTPRVSVVMSVRDGGATLRQAIRSIAIQTFTDWELLIIDDGSRDDSLAVAAEAAVSDPRIRSLDGGAGRGLPQRLNELVALAGGELIARMDADDVAYPERLERQVAFLDAHPEVDLVGAAMLAFGAGGVPLGRRWVPLSNGEISARPALRFRLFHPVWTGRAAWFRRFPYAVEAHRCEDQDVLHRAYAESVFANLPDILLGYREERIPLRGSLTAHRTLARLVGGRLWLQGRRGEAAVAVASHAARFGVDALAVGTGLGHRVLPHRARGLSEAETARWAEVLALTAG